MVKVKVCGMTDENIASKIFPDYLGVIVLTPNSKRNVGIDKAKEIIAHTNPEVKTVLVTREIAIPKLMELEKLNPDYIQIHVPLDSDELIRIRKYIGVGIISLINDVNASYIEEIAKVSDMVIFDTTVNGISGGLGIENDWNFVSSFRNKVPIGKMIVSGGININNMERIFKITKADVIDASSSLEIDGKKNLDLINQFIRKGRDLK